MNEVKRYELFEEVIGNATELKQVSCVKYSDYEALEKKYEELKGVTDLNNDEYVKQVGTWKIINRLEEQVEDLEAKLAEAKQALEEIRGEKC